MLFLVSIVGYGQVGYWKFNDNVADSSGNGYNGTATNITYANGKIGRSAVFNGSSSNVTTPTINYSSATKLTISFWFNPYPSTSGIVFESSDNYNNYNDTYVCYWSGSSLIWGIHGISALSYNVIEFGTSALENNWNYIVLEVDKTISIAKESAWINGVPATYTQTESSEITTNRTMGDYPLYFGSRGGSSTWFKGNIDDLKIYTSLLTTVQIKAEYDKYTAFYSKMNGVSSQVINKINTVSQSSISKVNSLYPLQLSGGSVTYDGDSAIMAFTSSGTLTVTSPTNVRVLVVAGGGGGGAQPGYGYQAIGGGGGGGIIHNTSYVIGSGRKAITVGAGGSGTTGANGGNSIFESITAYGGGSGSTYQGADGGCGGGSGTQQITTYGSGSQGYNGGPGNILGYGIGGGGGGMGSNGLAGTSTKGGNGGTGLQFNISGTNKYYSGGGGGGKVFAGGGSGGTGGSGIGGDGGFSGNGNSALDNTGGGGGGYGSNEETSYTSGNGGSGIVIIKWKYKPENPTFANGYQYRKLITTKTTNISSALTDFPLYVKVGSDVMGALIDQTNFYDIRFTDSTGTVIPYECESASSTVGNYWVKTSLTTTPTHIYCYYKNSTAQTNGSNTTGTWNSGYLSVYHFGNGSTISTSDVTSNNNTLTNYSATATTGITGGGAAFNGSQYMISANNIGISGNAARTLEIWVKTSTWNTGDYNGLIASGQNASNQLSSICIDPGGAGYGGFYGNDFQSYNCTNGTWFHIVVTHNGTVGAIFLNGVQGDTQNKTFNTLNSKLYIGKRVSNGTYHTGSLDEARMSNTARSADWIKFQYNNINSADQELTWSAQQTP